MKGQNGPLQDANAFRRLYERTHLIVYRYIFGYLGGAVHEAEDLTAETFIRAWRAHQHFEGDEEAAVGWLLRIARNLVIDNYRRKKAHGVDEDLEETHLSSSQAGPEEHLLLQEQMHILQRMLLDLEPEQREMIVLRYILEWPVNRIAAHMNMLENTVSVNLRRILQRLRADWPDK
jgi:RNA polymerase sigma-70 factor (ECF subfamily)